MTAAVKALLDQLKSREYRLLRTEPEAKPILYPVDFFGFHMGCSERPEVQSGNLSPNYGRIIAGGFDRLREELVQSIAAHEAPERKEFGYSMLALLDECIRICEDFREVVKDAGHQRLYEALGRVPRKGAESFFEACVFLKLLIYFLRVYGTTLLGIGRFDQYMYPYYLRDRARGISDGELFEILEAFFVSLNFDTDLYSGVQLGDNGQSMMLGGTNPDGSSAYNELSEMCMHASLELNLIDPKINLRVNRNTPDSLFLLGTKLTKKGLGFPQYSNDDVVIPGLIGLGYDPQDAYNYTVAACWEFIIPGCGADWPNLEVMNFPRVVGEVIREHLTECQSFEALMERVEQGIADACDAIVREKSTGSLGENRMLSLLMDGCIENLQDLWSGGAKYQNFGCHGAGIANATDALAAVRTLVFESDTVAKETLLSALEHNFEGFDGLRNVLRGAPKMGNNDDTVDEIACRIMDCFCRHMNHRDNGHGGIWRAGTGTAQNYVCSGEACPATADGRKAAEPYSSSFSPSLDVKTSGLLSVIQSFTKFDMKKIINGGPLTLEVHDTVFRNDIGIEKVALLVKAYIRMGGHQLQLNSVNRERLIDAKKHPENYPNLIVRVWGWSGYFNELDTVYQDHIIRRATYSF